MVITRERALIFGVFVLVGIAFLYFVLPQISGWHLAVDPQWRRQAGVAGDRLRPRVAVLRRLRGPVPHRLRARPARRIDWRASYEITMAGLAATRLFAAAGAGGVALTAWALRRSGMEPRVVACRMVAFLVLLYAVYMAARSSSSGSGCTSGLRRARRRSRSPSCRRSSRSSLIVAVPGRLAAARRRRAAHRAVGRRARGVRRASWPRWPRSPPRRPPGCATAIALVRDREWGVLGAVAWWAFEIATLWACFHAFGPTRRRSP